MNLSAALRSRTYVAIVRDLLTVLTGGTVAEVHLIGDTQPDSIALDNAPVRRISHLQGEIAVGEKRIDYRFTERDFELVGSDDNPDEMSVIRFRDHGRRPAPGSTVVINSYPVRLRPTPLNDVNVGSVVRTLLETASRELATQYVQLDRVYESAFVETATGSSLDKVVALVDVRRLRKGHPVGKVRFSRRSGAPGTVFIPIHTSVTDGEGRRYLTSHEGRLRPNQATAEIWVHGEHNSVEEVGGGKLTVLERVIAGIDRVTNDEPTWRATDDESDDQLAARARRAIHATGKGTKDAIRFGLESFDFVRSVSLGEYPDDPRILAPGTLYVDVALSEDNDYRKSQVLRRIEELRPAGIHIVPAWAEQIPLGFDVALHLAGATQPTSVLTQIQDGVRTRVVELARGLSSQSTLRRGRLLSTILSDDRIIDATVAITGPSGVISGDTWQMPAGKTARVDNSSVGFQPVTYEDSPVAEQFSLVQVDFDLVVTGLATTTTALEAALRPGLEAFLVGLDQGAVVSFTDVADRIRDDSVFVLRPTESVVAFDEEGGGFTEIRGSSGSWTRRPGLRPNLRAVRVEEASDT